jgi:hypothetical protein
MGTQTPWPPWFSSIRSVGMCPGEGKRYGEERHRTKRTFDISTASLVVGVLRVEDLLIARLSLRGGQCSPVALALGLRCLGMLCDGVNLPCLLEASARDEDGRGVRSGGEGSPLRAKQSFVQRDLSLFAHGAPQWWPTSREARPVQRVESVLSRTGNILTSLHPRAT